MAESDWSSTVGKWAGLGSAWLVVLPLPGLLHLVLVSSWWVLIPVLWLSPPLAGGRSQGVVLVLPTP